MFDLGSNVQFASEVRSKDDTSITFVIFFIQSEEESEDISSKSISLDTKPEPELSTDRRAGSTNGRYTPIFEPKVQQMYDQDSSVSSEGNDNIRKAYLFFC